MRRQSITELRRRNYVLHVKQRSFSPANLHEICGGRTLSADERARSERKWRKARFLLAGARSRLFHKALCINNIVRGRIVPCSVKMPTLCTSRHQCKRRWHARASCCNGRNFMTISMARKPEAEQRINWALAEKACNIVQNKGEGTAGGRLSHHRRRERREISAPHAK